MKVKKNSSLNMNIKKFKKTIGEYYRKHGRKMPWRETDDPYRILVSEIMLQQTQVDRVAKKYPEFIAAFPHFKILASAPLKNVLRVWTGMGYNRRALYLKKIAETVVRTYQGVVPKEITELERLPGIGPATARSIAAFAFNMPHAFIETNIRSVFIHEFFPGCRTVADVKLMPLVEQALDKKNPREWYYALMDYGAMIKKQAHNPSRRSAHHAQQPKFKGSNRELRGKMLKVLIKKSHTLADLMKGVSVSRQQLKQNLNALQNEGLLTKRNGKFIIA